MPKLFYIENVRHGGDCSIWWRPEGKGYTRNLDDAWKVDEEQGKRICKSRPGEDVMRDVESTDAYSIRVFPR